MAILTFRYDIPAPRFVHSFVYMGEEKERAALKEAEQEVAAKAGSDTEKWFRSIGRLRGPSRHAESRQCTAAAIVARRSGKSRGGGTRGLGGCDGCRVGSCASSSAS
jgi:hypothetical protein